MENGDLAVDVLEQFRTLQAATSLFIENLL
jgi:hypothetical protein